MKRVKFIAFICCVSLTSCKTYTMTVDELYNQLNHAKATETSYHLKGGGIINHKYVSNGIDSIICEDKSGHKTAIRNSPSIEMRITNNNGNRHVFYFDTMILEDSTITGMDSRFLMHYSKIKLSDIRNIELEDGHKAFKN